jgi:PAS domain S-box-containing protein
MNKAIRILLIEDNPGDARLLKETISEAGAGTFTLVHADRMSAGLDLLNRENIDLVLLDLSLPDCQGLDALTLTHSKAPRLPIVLMTGRDDEDLAVRALRLGAQDYLVKGQVEGRVLVRAIRYALERKKAERLMRAQFSTTRALAESSSLGDAAPAILEAFCDGLGWAVGALWVRGAAAERLRCGAFWSAPRSPVPEFEAATRSLVLAREEGLWGRVWQKGKLAWFSDLAKAEGFKRAAAAAKDGLRSAMAVPLIAGTDVIGVLEFFSRETTSPDEGILETLGGITGQVGQFIERKQGEAALNAIEDRFRSVVDSASDAILIADRRGIILTWNRGAEAIFGYTAGETVGQPLTMIMPERYRDLHRKGLARHLASGESRIIGRTVELEGLRKDGAEFPIAVSLSTWKSGGETFFGAIIADITERLKVDRIKNDFISTVSHELRTPLTSILGSLGLVSGGAAGELPLKAQALVAIAHKNSERLVRLINDILDVEKIESGRVDFHIRPIRLMPQVAASLEANRAYAERFGVTLQLESGLPEAYVEADPDRLNQVLTNLLSNACKFSPRGRPVSIGVSRRAPMIRVSITDRGAGIPEDFRPRIFQKFAQADSSDSRQKGGTGLGLSICKSIVEKMGGRIGFDSVVTAGTTFHFELPECHADSSSISSTNLRLRPRILVCEGHPETAALLVRMLDTGGIEADVARDGMQARALLAQHRYEAVALDLNLPGAEGLAFVRELRAKEATRDLPIIVMSVTSDPQRREVEGGAAKMADWLDKPVDRERLMAAVKQAVTGPGTPVPRILHVEDDADTQEVVSLILRNVARLTRAKNLKEARERLRRETFDLILLDHGLPDGAGLDLLADLKDPAGRSVPVVVFSAQDLGDDLSRQVAAALVKTRTSNQELLATIRSVLNRRGSTSSGKS